MSLVLAAAAPLALTAASRPDAEQAKIDRLLDEVRTSPATFVRNGVDYDGKRAAAHLARKLFFAGSRVQTARDFVLGVASSSSESGKPYLIRFAGQPARPLHDWLLERLAAIEPPPTPGRTPSPAARP